MSIEVKIETSMSRSRKPAVDAALSAHWQRAVTERRAFEIGLIIGQTSAAGVADALLTGIPVPSESGASRRSFLKGFNVQRQWRYVSLTGILLHVFICACVTANRGRGGAQL